MIDLKNWDPTDSNAASKAAERANSLETALIGLLSRLRFTKIVVDYYDVQGFNHSIEQAEKALKDS